MGRIRTVPKLKIAKLSPNAIFLSDHQLARSTSMPWEERDSGKQGIV